jgi:hypothetical protein
MAHQRQLIELLKLRADQLASDPWHELEVPSFLQIPQVKRAHAWLIWDSHNTPTPRVVR